jgi:hypothetical protein
MKLADIQLVMKFPVLQKQYFLCSFFNVFHLFSFIFLTCLVFYVCFNPLVT